MLENTLEPPPRKIALPLITSEAIYYGPNDPIPFPEEGELPPGTSMAVEVYELAEIVGDPPVAIYR